jgi:glycosyltransferase involved in cell wall biosynthesis
MSPDWAQRVAAILPALDEEEAIGATLEGIAPWSLRQVIVVDNGSRDRTAEIARARGAHVIREPRRGYGRACLAGMAALDRDVDIVVFLDADGSDDPSGLEKLILPIARGEADFVLGSRELGEREAGSLTPQQRSGNRLATLLLRLLFGARYTDLGPFRAIRRSALEKLHMREPDYGWTIEMQIQAHWQRLRTREVPVGYRRRRGGRSKVSGTFRGSLLAGMKILLTIFRRRLSRSTSEEC